MAVLPSPDRPPSVLTSILSHLGNRCTRAQTATSAPVAFDEFRLLSWHWRDDHDAVQRTVTGGHLPLGVTVTVAFLAGAAIGSFLNVVVYRVPRGLSVSKPRSFCPRCERQLSWWENIPVLSWLGLRGRCHGCHDPISIRYPLVELGNAVAFGAVAWAFHGTYLTLPYCALAATLLTIVLIDTGDRRAPRSIAATGTAAALVLLIGYDIWKHPPHELVGTLAGTAIGVAVYLVLARFDPDAQHRLGQGRTALLPAGCWLGGLPAHALLPGLASGVLGLGALWLGGRLRRGQMAVPADCSPAVCASCDSTCAQSPQERGVRGALAIAAALACAVSLMIMA